MVGVDVLFFRGRSWFWERLAANVGIVLLFGVFYVRFLPRSGAWWRAAAQRADV